MLCTYCNATEGDKFCSDHHKFQQSHELHIQEHSQECWAFQALLPCARLSQQQQSLAVRPQAEFTSVLKHTQIPTTKINSSKMLVHITQSINDSAQQHIALLKIKVSNWFFSLKVQLKLQKILFFLPGSLSPAEALFTQWLKEKRVGKKDVRTHWRSERTVRGRGADRKFHTWQKPKADAGYKTSKLQHMNIMEWATWHYQQSAFLQSASNITGL